MHAGNKAPLMAGTLPKEGAGEGPAYFRLPAARRVAARNHYLIVSIILNRKFCLYPQDQVLAR